MTTHQLLDQLIAENDDLEVGSLLLGGITRESSIHFLTELKEVTVDRPVPDTIVRATLRSKIWDASQHPGPDIVAFFATANFLNTLPTS